MIEHVIEAVLAIEHRQGREQGNIIMFPRRSDRGVHEVTNS